MFVKKSFEIHRKKIIYPFLLTSFTWLSPKWCKSSVMLLYCINSSNKNIIIMISHFVGLNFSPKYMPCSMHSDAWTKLLLVNDDIFFVWKLSCLMCGCQGFRKINLTIKGKHREFKISAILWKKNKFGRRIKLQTRGMFNVARFSSFSSRLNEITVGDEKRFFFSSPSTSFRCVLMHNSFNQIAN